MFKTLILPLAAAAALLAAGPALAADHTITVTARDTPYAKTFTSEGALVSTSYMPRMRPAVAHGDINGDGRDETVTAADGIVTARDGDTVVRRFSPFGDHAIIAIAVADINRDGRADIITGHVGGSPFVKSFSGADGTLLNAFLAGAGDKAIIAIAADRAIIAIAVGPDIRVYDAATLALHSAFMPFGGAAIGGLAVA